MFMNGWRLHFVLKIRPVVPPTVFQVYKASWTLTVCEFGPHPCSTQVQYTPVPHVAINTSQKPVVAKAGFNWVQTVVNWQVSTTWNWCSSVCGEASLIFLAWVVTSVSIHAMVWTQGPQVNATSAWALACLPKDHGDSLHMGSFLLSSSAPTPNYEHIPV